MKKHVISGLILITFAVSSCVNIATYETPDSSLKPLQSKIKRIILHEDSIAAEDDSLDMRRYFFNALANRLCNSATEKTAENLYLQGVCLEFQNDLEGAFSFYQGALLLKPESTTIQYAAKRLKKAVSITKKIRIGKANKFKTQILPNLINSCLIS